MSPLCVFIDHNCSRLFTELCVRWGWYSPLGLLYSGWNNPPPTPFRDYSNWLLPLTCNPIERKRLLYLTVKTHLYVPLCMRDVCHICSLAFETNEVLSSPLMSLGPQLPPVVDDGFKAKNITQVMLVVYGAQVMWKRKNLLGKQNISYVTDVKASGSYSRFFFLD